MPLKLVRRGQSPNWFIRGTIRGISVDESTGLSDRAAAEEALAIRSVEIITRSIHGDRAVRTFAETALSYMQSGGEAQHLAPILKHFGAKRLLTAIGQHEIDEAARILKPKAAPSTLNRQIYTPIAAVLYHGARKGWCDRPVIARPAQPKGRVRWITYEEAERLIEAATNLRPLIIFLLSTGCRLGEALSLQWRDVDLSAARVVFLDTKNGEDRGVPLHTRAVAALANLPHREGAVFRTHYGGERWDGRLVKVGDPYTDRGGVGGGQVKTAWAKTCKRAGLEDFTPHDCRHTWATWHYRQNRDIAELMKAGGWKSPEMVMRYTHVNTDQLADGMANIWGKSGRLDAADTVKPLQHKA